MKKIIFLTLIIGSAGCTQLGKKESVAYSAKALQNEEINVDQQRIVINFGSVNTKIYGDIAKQSKPRDFNLDRYKELLGKYKSKKASEFRKKLPDFEIQFLKPYEDTFVICIHSTKYLLSMCDDAVCAGVERKAVSDNGHILNEWAKELPSTTCAGSN